MGQEKALDIREITKVFLDVNRWSISDMAFLTNIPRSTLSEWLSDKRELSTRHMRYAIFNCSRYNNQYRKHRCNSEMSDLIKNERFEKLILITTSALEVGFNILDSDIHNIVIDGIDDIDSIIQCIGRKRVKKRRNTPF